MRTAIDVWILMLLLAMPTLARSEVPTASPESAEEGEEMAEDEAAEEEATAQEADHIRVQHVLIGFRGSVRGKTIIRTPEEAKSLAGQLLERARSGEPFDDLVRGFSDDDYPGVYELANIGVESRPGEFRRAGMVKGFGDVAFSLEVEEIGMTEYNQVLSRYGWHIIKRLD